MNLAQAFKTKESDESEREAAVEVEGLNRRDAANSDALKLKKHRNLARCKKHALLRGGRGGRIARSFNPGGVIV